MLLLGDCLEQMKTLDANSVDAVVTDPPYGLSFMGKKWDYRVPSVEIWKEIFRVLKPGGHVLSFGGTRTYHRMVVNIEDAGFEIRDQVQWIYGSGFPKSHNVSKAIDKMAGAEREKIMVPTKPGNHPDQAGDIALGATGMRDISQPATPEAKQWDGWGSALKPANEPICLARKPLEKGLTLAENVLKYGTGAINVDGCRIEAADQAVLDAAVKRMTGNAVKGNAIKPVSAQGRWPANILFDEEAAAVLDEQSGTLKTNPGKIKSTLKKNIGYGGYARIAQEVLKDSGGASRFFYVAKASKRERNAGLEGMPEKTVSHMITGSGKPSGSVAERSAEGQPNRFTASHTNFHPTVKPIKLMEYLITLITPPNGCVLDPFMGSGSTGVACKNLNRNFIGIEMNEEYFEIAKKRIGE